MQTLSLSAHRHVIDVRVKWDGRHWPKAGYPASDDERRCWRCSGRVQGRGEECIGSSKDGVCRIVMRLAMPIDGVMRSIGTSLRVGLPLEVYWADAVDGK